MKVKLLVSRGGPDGIFNRGDEIDVSADEAQRMVEAEQAEIVRAAPVERAVKPAKAEKAVR